MTGQVTASSSSVSRRALTTVEMEKRRGVARALHSDEADLGGGLQRSRDPPASSTRVQKSHSHRVEQRVRQARQERTDELRSRLGPQPSWAFDPERAFNEIQD
jgi:hypothetical protein